MSDGKHIVFFTPTLNRTGSELVLLNLLKNARLNAKLSVISKFKGTLLEQIPEGVEKNFLFGMQFGGLGNRFYNKIRRLFSVDQILKENAKGLWYINTIVLPDILELAELKKLRTIVHIHELQQMYAGLNEEHIKRLVNYPELIIANSCASADVVRKYGRKDKIEIVYPPLSEELSQKKGFSDKRSKYNIPKDTFVWMMCGTLDKNKDPFLFIEIASELKKRTNNFKMVWVGGKADDSDIDVQCNRLLEEKELKEHVMFISDVKDEFYDHFAMANGFVLTSQFESFSMTTLEALFLQLPIVANDCVGVKEVIGTEFGYLVKKKNDAVEFAEKMFDLMNLPLENKEKLRQRALEFSLSAISTKWNNIINKQLE